MKSDRREFLIKAGKVAVTAPAVAVLMQANAKQAAAKGHIVSGEPNPKQTDPE